MPRASVPYVVDPASRREIISFGQNANNHNGGTIAVGNDGYLYLGLGDGGNANDVGPGHIEPGGNAQNLTTPLGKVLRIDRLNPSLTPGSADPISRNGLEYDHSDGISITGGFVYRGDAIPELYGKCVFGDLALRNLPPRVDGRIFYADLDSGEILEFLLPQFDDGFLPDGLTVHGFGQDGSGELYALVTNTPANGTGGILYKIAPVPEPGTFALLGLGALGMLGHVWRRRRQMSCDGRRSRAAS